MSNTPNPKQSSACRRLLTKLKRSRFTLRPGVIVSDTHGNVHLGTGFVTKQAYEALRLANLGANLPQHQDLRLPHV